MNIQTAARPSTSHGARKSRAKAMQAYTARQAVTEALDRNSGRKSIREGKPLALAFQAAVR